jgi:hypothetical protein
MSKTNQLPLKKGLKVFILGEAYNQKYNKTLLFCGKKEKPLGLSK